MNLFIVPAYHRTLGLARLSAEFPDAQFTTVETQDFVAELRKYLAAPRGFERAVLFTYDLDVTPQIGVWYAILWWIARHSLVMDAGGRMRQASFFRLLLREGPQMVMGLVQLPFLLLQVMTDLIRLRKKYRVRYPDGLSIAYLRTDHWFGIKSGGSSTHIAGVANAFRDMGIPLFFLSTDRLALIDENHTPLFCVRPAGQVRNIRNAPELAYNRTLTEAANGIFRKRRPTLIYQRYSRYNYTGAYLARRWRLPFVLEYNGSEVWIARNWNAPMRFMRLAMKIELSNLRAADAIVVVSAALKHELMSRGISGRKILVNPNGVDPSRFDPNAILKESMKLRKELLLEDKVVVGFLGTFGPWHGAEVLARAIRPVIDRNPRVHFLFGGDGPTASAVREIIEETDVSLASSLAGMIPHHDVARYLGACDMFVSPHVPNPDGTPFFGSPTKLFEYMAMARGIVASRLDQIAQVLEHRRTGLLVTPGAVNELVEGILELAADPDERMRLGRNARLQVLDHHTWRAHSTKILEHLRNVLP